MVSLEFFFGIILPASLWPWGLISLSPGIFPGGKGGWCVGLTTLPPSRADCHEIWKSRSPGTLWACSGLLWDCLPFTFTFYVKYATTSKFFTLK